MMPYGMTRFVTNYVNIDVVQVTVKDDSPGLGGIGMTKVGIFDSRMEGT